MNIGENMTEHMRKFDVIIIGSGPGGEGASMLAAKEGRSVALIEKNPEVGGNCTHLGTIPSKTLRHIAHRLTTVQSDPLFHQYLDKNNITFSDLLARAKSVISQQVQIRSSHYSRNDVEVIHGNAKLVNSNTIFIDKKNGVSEIIEASNIIIATGSRPYRPEGIDFNHPCIFDSDTILSLNRKPRTVSIYGAGVIGCEYTSIFKSLGRKVNLINTHDKLLNFLDDEIIDALSYHLRAQGVLIRHNESLDYIEPRNDGVVLFLKCGKKILKDILLFAMGRVGNIDNLGLEDIGVEVNHRGQIKVNEYYQTSVPHIYAVGDLTGFPSLASSAYDQGRVAASHAVYGQCHNSLAKDIPIGIYTSPEISCIGQTEKELTANKIPYEVGHALFKNLAKAQIIGQPVGMLKILFHSKTLEVLGVHCFGQNAAEIIHIGQCVISQKGEANSLEYFTKTTFNYPTMAEAYRVAALNGLNRRCR